MDITRCKERERGFLLGETEFKICAWQIPKGML